MNHNAKQTVKYFVIAFIISFIIGQILSAIFSSAEEIYVDQEKGFDIVETDFDGIRLLTYETSEDLYSIKFELPVFKSDGLNNFFKGYMKRTNDQFLSAIEGNVTKERPGNLTVNLDIYQAGEDLYSLVFTEAEYTGGANVNETGHAWLVDVKTNRILKQGELFKNVRKAREIIRPKVQDALLEQEGLGIFEEELEEWVNQPKYMFENMYIHDGKMIFRFDKYEITPGATGMPKAEIPIDEEIQALLKKNWVQRLGFN